MIRYKEFTQEDFGSMFDYKEGKLHWKKKRANGKIKAGAVAGCTNERGYVQLHIGNKIYYAHRIIYLLVTGELPEYIDHRDGNQGNNHIDNLRPCTLSQNQYNRKAKKESVTGKKGIAYDRKAKLYKPCVKVKGKDKVLGYYKRLQDAVNARTIFINKTHIDFARGQ